MEDYVYINSERLRELNRHEAAFRLLDLGVRNNGDFKTRFIRPEVTISSADVAYVGKPKMIVVQNPPENRLYESIFSIYSYMAPPEANAFVRSEGSLQIVLGGSSKGKDLFHTSGIDVGAVQYWKIPDRIPFQEGEISFAELHQKYIDLPRH